MRKNYKSKEYFFEFATWFYKYGRSKIKSCAKDIFLDIFLSFTYSPHLIGEK